MSQLFTLYHSLLETALEIVKKYLYFKCPSAPLLKWRTVDTLLDMKRIENYFQLKTLNLPISPRRNILLIYKLGMHQIVSLATDHLPDMKRIEKLFSVENLKIANIIQEKYLNDIESWNVSDC